MQRGFLYASIYLWYYTMLNVIPHMALKWLEMCECVCACVRELVSVPYDALSGHMRGAKWTMLEKPCTV